MNFGVRVHCENYYASHIRLQETGLKHVDMIRSAVGIPLDLDRIKETISRIRQDHYIIIPEEIARKANLFNDRNYLIVTVPKRYCNDFHILVVKTDQDEKTGEIREAFLEWEFQESKFLEHWEELGFPEKVEK